MKSLEQTKQDQTEVRPKAENPLYNLLFNIILPVTILNQLSKRLGPNGPLWALLLALALPIIYGGYDYLKKHKKNYISLLGIINIAITGGFALLSLEGIWFAVKEAAFPLLIGVAVLISSFIQKPFLFTLFWNEHIFQTKKIDEKIRSSNRANNFLKLFKDSNNLFALSFLLSAILNFVLAISIFLPISADLPANTRHELLNEQIAKMTWKGYLVIALPMMVFTGFIFWFLINGLKKLTGFTTDDLLVHHEPPAKSH